MKSQSMNKHYRTLIQQREKLFPTLQSLEKVQLWEKPKANKWSIGETMYHLYLMIKTARIAASITIPSTTLVARRRRHKPFAADIHDIYTEYKEKHGKGMKAPFILNPPKKIHNTMDFTELTQLLNNETSNVVKMVENIDEDIAGHIIFLDPVAKYPNLIQAMQLLAIHEAHHFRIIQRDLEPLTEKTDTE
ncbi:DinB family protein [Salsuginibacillus kocurii]|uniref:DinB family protein n=1 Tax=Salsuginibacillus kocurii TaxID=427078 RepID=UPI000373A734|nr:DinB family protein [Salsuginibacillus kocurii]